jgi:hypothetical protein
MKWRLTVSALIAVSALTGTSRADPGQDAFAESGEPPSARPEAVAERKAPARAPSEDHPTPRLKLSYERFSAGNVDGTAVPLEALHLDTYFLSWRWLRAGVEAEAGRGHATLYGGAASLKHGLVGLNAGLQLPGRVTPFIEGRLDAGVLYGSLDGTVTIPGMAATVRGVAAATYLYARGVDVGAEVYTFGRAYLSLSLGWLRTTWGSTDYEAMLANASAGLTFKNVTHDSFLFKLGLGI